MGSLHRHTSPAILAKYDIKGYKHRTQADRKQSCCISSADQLATDDAVGGTPELEDAVYPDIDCPGRLGVPSSCYGIRTPCFLPNPCPRSDVQPTGNGNSLVNATGMGTTPNDGTSDKDEGQLCATEAPRHPSVSNLQYTQHAIKRKKLPPGSGATGSGSGTVEPNLEPIELSADGEEFSRELETRFSLNRSLELLRERPSKLSPNSTWTSSLGKPVAMKVLCTASYGKESVIAQHRRSIRETFQDAVSNASSVRWLRSIGKGRKTFSRPPIPRF